MSRKKNRGVVYEPDASSEWYTPRVLRELAQAVLAVRPGSGITLDPATCAENPLGAAHYFTADSGVPMGPGFVAACVAKWCAVLALAQASCEVPTIWLNPPYGRETPRWLEALAAVHAQTYVDSLVLVPCRPGSRWYKQATGPLGADLVCELDGRVAFDARDATGAIVAGTVPARWACVLLYRRAAPTAADQLGGVRRLLARYGQVRLSGHTRRTAERRAWTAAPGPSRAASRCLGERTDPRQLAWPDNVIPLQPRKGTP